MKKQCNNIPQLLQIKISDVIKSVFWKVYVWGFTKDSETIFFINVSKSACIISLNYSHGDFFLS